MDIVIGAFIGAFGVVPLVARLLGFRVPPAVKLFGFVLGVVVGLLVRGGF